MIARVVTKRDDARLAAFLVTLPVVFLALVVADDAWHLRLFSAPNLFIYGAVAATIALAGIAPWVVWSRRRGRAVEVRCHDGVVQAGRLRIASEDVSALAVANGARGMSLAVEHGQKQLAFFEVERAEDAARIAETLGLRRRPLREVVIAERSRILSVPQAIMTLVALVFAPLYFLAATRGVTPLELVSDEKPFFGIGGVVAAGLLLALLLVRRLLPNQAIAVGTGGAWDTHVALHRKREPVPAEAPEDARVRVGNLARGDEGVGAWLQRIDAIPIGQHAYRGAALDKDVLWDTLGDAGAVTDARMAAARLLRRRFGEEEAALVRVVEDADIRARIEAVLDEQEDAERRIETLGPLFRAR